MVKKKFMIILLAIAFVLPFVAANTGCCLNPQTIGCDITTRDVCCPINETYNQTIGPNSQGNCTTNWFYPSNDSEACSRMNVTLFPNAQYCKQGCCCRRPLEFTPELPVSSGQDFRLLCLGDGEVWLNETPSCSNSTCLPIMYPAQGLETGCAAAFNTSCDPLGLVTPKALCKGVVNGSGVPTGNGVCCYKEECGGMTGRGDFCVLANTTPFEDIYCANGTWVNSTKTVGSGNVCARLKEYAFDGTPIFEKTASCNEGLFCKPAFAEEEYSVCCNASQCGVYDIVGSCLAEGSDFNISDKQYNCTGGEWKSIQTTKLEEGMECKASAECEPWLACLTYNLPRNEGTPMGGVKRCCLKDGSECASADNCVKDGTVNSWRAYNMGRLVGENEPVPYHCNDSRWTHDPGHGCGPQPHDLEYPLGPYAAGNTAGGGCSGSTCGGQSVPPGDETLTDTDGDGVVDAVDNCVNVPNPPAEVGGVQPDADGDGIGDACDEPTTIEPVVPVGPPKANNTWVWILIAVLVAAAIAAFLYFGGWVWLTALL
jgi:hypothetical protein